MMLAVSALAIAFTWAAIAAVLAGIGGLFLSRFSKQYFLMDACWMGLCVCVVVLEIWSLARPITSAATVFLFCAGVLGFLVSPLRAFARLKAAFRAAGWWILVPIVVVLFLALRACGPCDYGDTGLYGAPAIRWIMTYPAVPGLANIHGRLGFNSSVFLCVAALNQGVWKDLAHHLFAGFVLAGMALTLLPSALRAVRRRPVDAADWFRCILLIPVAFWVMRSKIVGTLTDEPAAIAVLVAVGILFDTFCAKSGEEERRQGYSRLVLAATLLALAVVFKMSTIVFASLAWCLALGLIWRMKCSGKERSRYLGGALVLSMLILVPWCVRGIVLSGYPFYPAAVLGIPADWKVPPGEAHWYAAGVRSWGRNSDAYFLADTQGLGWLSGWLYRAVRNRVSFQAPVGISMAGLAVLLVSRLRKNPVPLYPWLWLLLPSLAGVVFWFWASPDFRFGEFAIWTTAGTLGAWGIVAAGAQGVPGGLARTGLLALAIWCLAGFGWTAPYRALFAVKELQSLPTVGVSSRYTLSGLAVYVPQDENCWDAPLPCTPYFDETVRLRNRSSMRWGFASQGRGDFERRIWSTPIR